MLASYSRSELVVLAARYADHTGVSEATVGFRACRNDKLFSRLRQGLDCRTTSAERASRWFEANWPATLAWPKKVRRLKPETAGVTPPAEPGMAPAP
jgi:hypothetical protein